MWRRLLERVVPRRIATRLTALVVGLLAPLVILGMAVARANRSGIDSQIEAARIAHELRQLAQRSHTLVLAQNGATKGMFMDDDALLEHAELKIEAYDENARTLARLDSMASSAQIHRLVRELRDLDAAQLQPAEARILEALIGGDRSHALQIYRSTYVPIEQRYADLVNQLSLTASSEALDAEQQLAASSVNAFRISAGFLLSSAIVVALIVFFYARSTGRLVNRVARRATQIREQLIDRLAATSEAVADGVLEVDLDVGMQPLMIRSNDEIGLLADTLDGMTESTRITARAFEQSVATIRELIGESHALTDAARNGTLDRRGDRDRFRGGFRVLLDGMNTAIDAFAAPTIEAAAVLQRVAARDLCVRMSGDYHGDHRVIRDGLNVALEQLDAAFGEVRRAAESVALASDRIAEGGEALASRTQAQAQALEETAASVRQITAHVRATSANAARLNEVTTTASRSVENGAEHTQQLTDAMDRIRASADATSKVVHMIGEIAFQTNLLALNAAVEAARAGHEGRGFAVVADEVRRLALRSSEAARSTEQLIAESAANTDAGVRAATAVRRVLVEIQDEVRRVNGVTAEISAAMQEQATGIGQIDQAIEHMDEVTRQIADTAESAAQTAETMSGEASELERLVSGFSLSGAAGLPNTRTSTAAVSGSSPVRLPGSRQAGCSVAAAGRSSS